MKKLLVFLTSAILLGQGLLEFYKYIAVVTFATKTYIDLLNPVLFLILAILNLKFSNNKIFQWVVVLITLFFFMGGIIGLGWMTALILAIFYILLSRENKKQIPVQPAPVIPTEPTTINTPVETTSTPVVENLAPQSLTTEPVVEPVTPVASTTPVENIITTSVVTPISKPITSLGDEKTEEKIEDRTHKPAL